MLDSSRVPDQIGGAVGHEYNPPAIFGHVQLRIWFTLMYMCLIRKIAFHTRVFCWMDANNHVIIHLFSQVHLLKLIKIFEMERHEITRWFFLML